MISDEELMFRLDLVEILLFAIASLFLLYLVASKFWRD